jgi:hypothetical protein
VVENGEYRETREVSRGMAELFEIELWDGLENLAFERSSHICVGLELFLIGQELAVDFSDNGPGGHLVGAYALQDMPGHSKVFMPNFLSRNVSITGQKYSLFEENMSHHPILFPTLYRSQRLGLFQPLL